MKKRNEAHGDGEEQHARRRDDRRKTTTGTTTWWVVSCACAYLLRVLKDTYTHAQVFIDAIAHPPLVLVGLVANQT